MNVYWENLVLFQLNKFEFIMHFLKLDIHVSVNHDIIYENDQHDATV
jgi:hypothetical protein